MTDIRYCIQHQRTAMNQNSPVGDCHEVFFFNDYGQLDIDWCFYPLGSTSSEPPEIEDWEIGMVEPSPEEMEEIERNAEELLYDFI